MIPRDLLADHRQHRGVRELEHKQAPCKDVKLCVFADIENTVNVACLLANSCIAGARIIDFIAANANERDKGRDTKHSGAKEYCAFGHVVTRQAHRPCCKHVAKRIEASVASCPCGHCAAADQSEAYCGNRRGDDGAAHSV